MANTVVGIRFKAVGKKYYFDPAGLDLKVHDNVIVETVRGVELGEIIEEAKVIEDSEVISTLKPILRLATNDDLMAYERNQKDIAPTLERVKFHVKQNKLEMKLLGCEYTLDRSKLIIYFNAEGRVDFRELVKDLANEFKLRIELRQVGTRDGAKFLGGIGPCGYLLCCNTFLGDFDTVSIKMAKNQNLSLNPANISGLCGKLLCCIRYEDDLYTEYRKSTPKVGTYVKTVDGRGRVISANIINQSVRIQTPEEGIRSYQIDDLVDIEEYDLKEDNHGE